MISGIESSVITCETRKLKVIIETIGRSDLQKQRSKRGGRGERKSHLLFYLSTTYLVVTCSCAGLRDSYIHLSTDQDDNRNGGCKKAILKMVVVRSFHF